MTADRRCRRVGARMALAALEGRSVPRRHRRHGERCDACGERAVRAARARLVLTTMGSEESPAPAVLVPSVMAGLDGWIAATEPGRTRAAAIAAAAAALGAGVAVALVTRRRTLAST